MDAVILHIDEQPDLPKGVAEMLRKEGYSLLQTDDPEEAIRLVEERRPVLVIMEIEFQGCDGPDLMAGIQARTEVPVLVVTTAPRHSPMHGEAIILGARDFLTKPVLSSEFLSAVREAAPPPRQSEPSQSKPRRKSPDTGEAS